jgi:hypothetical protein
MVIAWYIVTLLPVRLHFNTITRKSCRRCFVPGAAQASRLSSFWRWCSFSPFWRPSPSRSTLYARQRKSAAGRTCKANLAAISSALSANALRTNAYPTATSAAMTAALVGAAEGLASMPKCPIDGSAYGFSGGGAVATHVFCPNNDNAAANSHNGYGGEGTATAGGDGAGDWQKVLAAPAADALP